MYLWFEVFPPQILYDQKVTLLTVSDDQSLQSLKTDQFSFQKKGGHTSLGCATTPKTSMWICSLKTIMNPTQVRA